MRSYLEMLETKVDKASFILLVRGAVNWCNGTLMGISATRKRLNAAEFKEGEQPTMDTVEHHGEAAMEQSAERAEELGFGTGLTPLQRGEAFASIRKFLFDLALERGWDGFDKPRAFKEYIESRIQGMRIAQITDADVKREMRNSIGSTAAEARAWLVASNKKQAAKLEEEMEYLIAEDGTYSQDMDPDEALDLLGIISKHRMRTKLISGLCFEADRINMVRQDYPNFEELRTKRHMLLVDALFMYAEMEVFEKANRPAINKELEANPRMTLTGISEGHRIRLALTKKALEEEREIQKELARERLGERAVA